MTKPLPVIFRKRLIPDECVELNDEILLFTQDMVITRWNALKPKPDLHHGMSCYFLKEGFKVSKFYYENNTLLYWYCDIVEYEFKRDEGHLIVTDLLADVIVEPDGFVKVIDLDELAQAAQGNLIQQAQLYAALRKLNNLLSYIYSGRFPEIQKFIEDAEASR